MDFCSLLQCQCKGLFSSLGSCVLFLVPVPSAIAGQWEGMKAVWAISFKQSRDIYHDCSPFTTTMCACAQFTVVVFPRGLWYGFIGCSRCPFGCKCIYLNRKIYTRILENACVFFIYCNILELSFLRKKKKKKVYNSFLLPPFFFLLSNDSFILQFLLPFSFESLSFFFLLFHSNLTFSFVPFP